MWFAKKTLEKRKVVLGVLWIFCLGFFMGSLCVDFLFPFFVQLGFLQGGWFGFFKPNIKCKVAHKIFGKGKNYTQITETLNSLGWYDQLDWTNKFEPWLQNNLERLKEHLNIIVKYFCWSSIQSSNYMTWLSLQLKSAIFIYIQITLKSQPCWKFFLFEESNRKPLNFWKQQSTQY